MRAALAAVSVALFLASGACLHERAVDPAVLRPDPAPAEAVEVIELVDRGRRSPRSRGRRLIDAAILEIAPAPDVLSAWSAVVGAGDPERVLAGHDDRAPDPILLSTVSTRVRLARQGRDGGLVVVARPGMTNGRYAGLVGLLAERAPGEAVALAVCDLLHVADREAGWDWDAGVLLVGHDPVAVDRVALRILDSARRATGAEGLEDGTGAGHPDLAAAAGASGGVADLAEIVWRKVAVRDEPLVGRR